MLERRFSALEFRVEGRRLTGTVLRYGEISPSHRERFEPGAFRMADTVPLNLAHDIEKAIAWMPDGGLELADGDGALELSAELPPIPAGNRALDDIRTGKANGLSVEFHAVRERREGAIRIIEEAELTGIAIVKSPSYEGSRVEARSRRLLWLP